MSERLSAEEQALADAIAEARWPVSGDPIHQGGVYERALVARAILGSDWYADLAAHLADVEARLAAIEALADEWEAAERRVEGTRRGCVSDLRAALHPDATEGEA